MAAGAEQEQDVVVAGQDVTHALGEELPARGRLAVPSGRIAGGGCARVGARCRAGRARAGGRRARRLEHGQHHVLSRTLHLGDAAMGRIDVGEERIADPRWCRQRTRRGQVEHRVGAVVAPLEAASGRGQRAALDRQPLQRIGLDARPGGAHFAPRELAVGVAVEVEGDVEVAQGDVPAHLELRRRDRQLQVRVARLVRVRGRGDGEQRGGGERADDAAPPQRRAGLRAGHRCAGRAGRPPP